MLHFPKRMVKTLVYAGRGLMVLWSLAILGGGVAWLLSPAEPGADPWYYDAVGTLGLWLFLCFIIFMETFFAFTMRKVAFIFGVVVFVGPLLMLPLMPFVGGNTEGQPILVTVAETVALACFLGWALWSQIAIFSLFWIDKWFYLKDK